MARRIRYATLLLLTCGLGLAVRFAAVGLPRGVTKYGGSALWAAAIFWLVSLVLPQRGTKLRVAIALVLASAIEFLKLLRTPALDAFRLTLSGKLLLGRFFSVWDLVAYTLALIAAAWLDRFTASSRSAQ